MKVFKACMLVIKHYYMTYIINIVIFMVLAIVISGLMAQQFDTNFFAVRPNLAIVNRDGENPIVEGLIKHMRENSNEVELDDDRRALQDATFYHAVDYILIIPQGFRDSFIEGAPIAIETVQTTQTARGFVADSLALQYLNLVRVYMAAGGGMSEEAIVSAVLRDLSDEATVVKKQFGTSAPVNQVYIMYVQMLNFILLTLVFLSVTNVTMVFKRCDLRMRNLCAPLKPRSLSLQQVLACAAMSTFVWILLSTAGVIMYGGNLGGVDTRIIALMLLNSFVITIFALALAALASNFVSSSNAQNAVANIMTLALCFLGGVFVPRYMLSDGILAVSRFLPTYWNVIALERATELTSFYASALTPFWQAIAIQLAFAAAVFCVSLVIGKHISQSERFVNSVRTELEG